MCCYPNARKPTIVYLLTSLHVINITIEHFIIVCNWTCTMWKNRKGTIIYNKKVHCDTWMEAKVYDSKINKKPKTFHIIHVACWCPLDLILWQVCRSTNQHRWCGWWRGCTTWFTLPLLLWRLWCHLFMFSSWRWTLLWI